MVHFTLIGYLFFLYMITITITIGQESVSVFPAPDERVSEAHLYLTLFTFLTVGWHGDKVQVDTFAVYSGAPLWRGPWDRRRIALLCRVSP